MSANQIIVVSFVAAILAIVVSALGSIYHTRRNNRYGLRAIIKVYESKQIDSTDSHLMTGKDIRCTTLVIAGTPYIFAIGIRLTASHLVLYPRLIFGIRLTRSLVRPIGIPLRRVTWQKQTIVHIFRRINISGLDGEQYTILADIGKKMGSDQLCRKPQPADV